MNKNLNKSLVYTFVIVAVSYFIITTILFYYPPSVEEGWYNWQTEPVDADLHEENPCPVGVMGKDIRYPHYTHHSNHQLFLNPNHVGCGSCIYSKESQNDTVLQDWKCTKQLMTKWKSAPLDSDIYDFEHRHGFIPNTQGCLCDQFH